MASSRRRCPLCHHWFKAHPRVGDRQKVCSRSECQERRRQGTQAAWRKAHPGYFIERRIRKRLKEGQSEVVDVPRVPPPLSRLPWELAQEEFGVGGADFMASLGRLLVEHAQDQIRVQVLESKGESPKVRGAAAQDQILTHPLGIIEESGQVLAGVPKDQILGVPG
jgi:hypothetical protein